MVSKRRCLVHGCIPLSSFTPVKQIVMRCEKTVHSYVAGGVKHSVERVESTQALNAE